MRDINQISAEIIDAAMKVHSARGPGLLESKLETLRVPPRRPR
ncbi:MAG TPA: hypothetical protein VK797_29750 [Tepidisphaeraceae bacterium]|jgi:hypothetical protein|nr:hypothetical protein [Tepidisphaeraceae bacterium]